MENRPDGKVGRWLDGTGSGSCPVKSYGISSGWSLGSTARVSSSHWLSVLSRQNQNNVVKISSLDPMPYKVSPQKKIRSSSNLRTIATNQISKKIRALTCSQCDWRLLTFRKWRMFSGPDLLKCLFLSLVACRWRQHVRPEGPSLMLTTRLCLVLTLRMRGIVPPLPRTSSCSA